MSLAAEIRKVEECSYPGFAIPPPTRKIRGQKNIRSRVSALFLHQTSTKTNLNEKCTYPRLALPPSLPEGNPNEEIEEKSSSLG